MTRSAPSPRLWLRFSLQGLLLFTTLFGVGLGWVAKERRQSGHERQFADKLLALGHHSIFLGGPYDSLKLRLMNKRQSWWSDLAHGILGDRIVIVMVSNTHDFDAFGSQRSDLGDLTALAGLKNLAELDLDLGARSLVNLAPLTAHRNLKELHLSHTPVNDLRPLAAVRNLESFSFHGESVTDFSPLAKLTKLRHLDLASTLVHDVAPIAELKALRKLNLSMTSVSDLTPLAGLKELQVLDVSRSSVSDDQINALRAVLPNCKIVRK
jgi:hypothetical protein